MAQAVVKSPKLLPADIAEIKSPVLIDFFLDAPEDIQNNADVGLVNTEETKKNTDKLIELEPKIESNTGRLDVLEPKVNDNSQRLDSVEPAVISNTNRLDVIEPSVTSNTGRLDTVEPKVTTLETDLSTHTGSNSQHGVTGDNVGNQDFCDAVTGGVVLLAAEIAGLTPITDADATDLPTVITLANSTKVKVNEIVSKINEIIAGQQDAKQMGKTIP